MNYRNKNLEELKKKIADLDQEKEKKILKKKEKI